jgi:hypothetical protein
MRRSGGGVDKACEMWGELGVIWRRRGWRRRERRMEEERMEEERMEDEGQSCPPAGS